MRVLTLVLACLAGPALPHEYWLEPLDYLVSPDGRLQADLVNGQNFDGPRFAYLSGRFERFEMQLQDQAAPVENRMGARPALDGPPLGEGLHVVTYVSTISRVNYDTFEKFLSFADHKDFPDARSDHLARGLPTESFGEAYSRFAKTLIGVGHATGVDRRTGMETELVALANPYVDDLSAGLPVQVFYRDAPRPAAQIELFEKSPDGTVGVTYHRTDAQGIATLPVRPGHSYLVDAVVLRVPDPDLAEDRDVVWETLWASLTFAVP